MIRPFTNDDLEAVLDVWQRAAAIAHSFLSEEFLKTERTLIAEQWLPASETIVYEDEGRVVGFLSLNANEVGGIFVDPDCQDQGVGRALMDRARASRPQLELTVFEANAKARRFYEAYGFVEVERVADGIEGNPELRLRLADPSP